MANVYPTHFDVLRNLFPELTETQCTITFLFSMGYTMKEISIKREISASTVKNTLNAVKNKLDQESLNGVRCVVLIRLLLRGVF
ncbi:TPA: helix-turn-helix transcriptional regulator [Enterobacter roggenkampii]